LEDRLRGWINQVGPDSVVLMKAFFITVVLIAIVGYIGYEAWIVMNGTGLGQKLNQNQQTVNDVDK
jgi:hypothetical protein